MLAQAHQRAALVAPHEARIADNVCGQDCCQFALLTGHGSFPRYCSGSARLPGNRVGKQGTAATSGQFYPLMAAFNAIALMSTNPWSARPSIFVI
jgi:hypothetical protein